MTTAGLAAIALPPAAASGQEAKQPGQTPQEEVPAKPGRSATGSLRRKARYLVDCHVHVGAPPKVADAADKVHSFQDWVKYRTEHAKEFAQIFSEPMIDNSDALIKTMEAHGVTHAIIQVTPGLTSHEVVAEAAKKHKGRLFPLYRSLEWLKSTATGQTGASDDPKAMAENLRRVIADVEKLFPAMGFIGIGEMTVGGYMTAEIDPVKMVRDVAPLMEALRAHKAMLTLPTGSIAFKGSLPYIYDLLWVDELAGNFPDVPIVLTKMGRKFNGSFDTCLVVANRNANVFLDLTDSKGEHVRAAIDLVGAQRVMFGTDLHAVSRDFAYDEAVEIVADARLSDEEWEWVAWKTANQVYRLAL